MPNHYGGDLLHTMAISGLSRVRTELLHLFVVPAAPPHPVQLDRQLAGHRDFRDLAPAPHGQMKELAAPLHLLRTVTCAASTSRKRNRALPCRLAGALQRLALVNCKCPEVMPPSRSTLPAPPR